MKYLITSLFLLLGTITRAQDFYDMNTIQTIEVTFSQSNWDQLLDNAYATTGDYIMAQSVTINGVTFDSVGVKYKGNSSYSANQVKNPWHIELNTYKDRTTKVTRTSNWPMAPKTPLSCGMCWATRLCGSTWTHRSPIMPIFM